MDAKLEHFVTHVGGCGRFHVFFISICILMKIVSVWDMLVMVFAGFDPGWTCAVEQGIEDHTGNISEMTFKYEMMQPSNKNYSLESRTCDTRPACHSFIFLPGTSTAISEWDLVCHRAWIPKLIISLQMVGVTVGSALGGYSSDKFGRKTSLFLWTGVSSVANVIAVFSVSWQMLATVLFFLGLSAGGLHVTFTTFSQEFITSKWRMIIAGFPVWNVAGITFGICFWILKDWRYVHIALAVLSVLAFLAVAWVPESMRWLAVHGHAHRAQAVARRICELNKKTVTPLNLSVGADCENESDAFQTPRLSLLFQRPLIKTTILCSCFSFFLQPIYFSINFGIQTLFGNFYHNFLIFMVVPIPALPAVTILGEKVGRRLGIFIVIAIAAVFSASVEVVFFTVEGGSKEITITVLAISSSIFIDIATKIVMPLSAELFPTVIRSMGIGMVQTMGRMGAILAPILIPQSPQLLYVSYLAICGMCIICCIVILFLPETKGQPLRDNVQLELKGKRPESKDTQLRDDSQDIALTSFKY